MINTRAPDGANKAKKVMMFDVERWRSRAFACVTDCKSAAVGMG